MCRVRINDFCYKLLGQVKSRSKEGVFVTNIVTKVYDSWLVSREKGNHQSAFCGDSTMCSFSQYRISNTFCRSILINREFSCLIGGQGAVDLGRALAKDILLQKDSIRMIGCWIWLEGVGSVGIVEL